MNLRIHGIAIITGPLRYFAHARLSLTMETLLILLALCEGNPLVTSGFPSQKASNLELWCFPCCYLNMLFNKHLSHQCDTMTFMWHHCNVCCRLWRSTCGTTWVTAPRWRTNAAWSSSVSCTNWHPPPGSARMSLAMHCSQKTRLVMLYYYSRLVLYHII